MSFAFGLLDFFRRQCTLDLYPGVGKIELHEAFDGGEDVVRSIDREASAVNMVAATVVPFCSAAQVDAVMRTTECQNQRKS